MLQSNENRRKTRQLPWINYLFYYIDNKISFSLTYEIWWTLTTGLTAAIKMLFVEYHDILLERTQFLMNLLIIPFSEKIKALSLSGAVDRTVFIFL